MSTGLVTARWRDYQGRIGRTKFWTTSSLNADLIVSAIANLTNCALASYIGVSTSPPKELAYGAAAQFRDAEDKAVLSFVAGTGVIVKLSVPAPNSSIFLADLETVDPANSAVQQLQTAMIDGATTRSGAPLSFMAGAVRLRRARQRRTTIITRSAGGGPA